MLTSRQIKKLLDDIELILPQSEAKYNVHGCNPPYVIQATCEYYRKQAQSLMQQVRNTRAQLDNTPQDEVIQMDQRIADLEKKLTKAQKKSDDQVSLTTESTPRLSK